MWSLCACILQIHPVFQSPLPLLSFITSSKHSGICHNVWLHSISPVPKSRWIGTPLMSKLQLSKRKGDPKSNPCINLCQMKSVLLYCASIPLTVQVQTDTNTAKCLISDMMWSAWSQCRAFAQELIALLKETTLGDTASSAGSGKSRHCKVDTQVKQVVAKLSNDMSGWSLTHTGLHETS